MEYSYTQTDITEKFGQNSNLKIDEWISTFPLNQNIIKEEAIKCGLPPNDATKEEIYGIASKLSDLRNSLVNSDDGVYCPVCHIANINLQKLSTPCPKCGRKLLRFGWN